MLKKLFNLLIIMTLTVFAFSACMNPNQGNNDLEDDDEWIDPDDTEEENYSEYISDFDRETAKYLKGE